MKETKRRYLIVAPADIANLVMAQVLLMALKKKHPKSLIDVIADENLQPLLERMVEVDHILTLPFAYNDLQLMSRYRLGRQLRDRYDEAIVIPLSLQSALIPAFAGIPVRTGWLGQMRYGLLNDIRLLNNKRYLNAWQPFIALAEPANAANLNSSLVPELAVDNDQFETLRVKFGLVPDKPALALCFGVDAGVKRRWSMADYLAVAERKIDEGWQVWLLGSGKDRVMAEDVRTGLSNVDRKQCFNLAGQTSLKEVVDMLAMANEVVSLDAGLQQIAKAVGKDAADLTVKGALGAV